MDLVYLVLLVAVGLVGAAIVVRMNRVDRDGDWHPDPNQYAQMRRYINGDWQRRQMTAAEMDEEFASNAW